MKLISWNVNGLRAYEAKGFSDTFGQLDLAVEGYESYWN